MAMRRRVKVFFDGGWRPATGMETAVVVRGREYMRRDLGPGSSMEAEWLALLYAADIAAALELAEPVFLGDSLAVIAQAKGTAPCRGACARHGQALAALGTSARLFRIGHVKRSQNLAGIALAGFHER
jgi:ribonuclease HI